MFKWQPRRVPGKGVVNCTDTFTVDFWRAHSTHNGKGGVFRGPGSRMEEEVALSSPQELLHLVAGREEIAPFQPPTPDPSHLMPPRGWSMGKSQCGVQVGGLRFHKGVREARLNLNLVTLVDPAPQLHLLRSGRSRQPGCDSCFSSCIFTIG